jgi:hypothetical protein
MRFPLSFFDIMPHLMMHMVENYSKLPKRNTLHHHMGMTGYAAKRPKWRQEEREAAEARQENPL